MWKSCSASDSAEAKPGSESVNHDLFLSGVVDPTPKVQPESANVARNLSS